MQTEKILLDTHIWLWLLTGDQALRQNIKKLIDKASAENEIFISAISIWEIAMLVSKDKIILNVPCLTWVSSALSLPGVNLVHLTPPIAVESCQLAGNFHGDPADRILVATAKIEDLILITHDKKILKYCQNEDIKTIAA